MSRTRQRDSAPLPTAPVAPARPAPQENPTSLQKYWACDSSNWSSRVWFCATTGNSPTSSMHSITGSSVDTCNGGACTTEKTTTFQASEVTAATTTAAEARTTGLSTSTARNPPGHITTADSFTEAPRSSRTCCSNSPPAPRGQEGVLCNWRGTCTALCHGHMSPCQRSVLEDLACQPQCLNTATDNSRRRCACAL